jgi:hypothetical protein
MALLDCSVTGFVVTRMSQAGLLLGNGHKLENEDELFSSCQKCKVKGYFTIFQVVSD